MSEIYNIMNLLEIIVRFIYFEKISGVLSWEGLLVCMFMWMGVFVLVLFVLR